MKLAVSLLIACLLLVLVGSTAQARRYSSVRNGKQIVIHDRRAPVIAHKVVPPFYGVHMYESKRRPFNRVRRSR